MFFCVYNLGCKPELQMMYAGSKLKLIQEAQATKVCNYLGLIRRLQYKLALRYKFNLPGTGTKKNTQ